MAISKSSKPRLSHLLREPCEALNGLSYGQLLAKTIRQLGWWSPKPQRVVEVGAGLGYLSQEMAKELSPLERRGVEYIFLDLTRAFLQSQFALAKKAGWDAKGPERERGTVAPGRGQRGPGHRQ